ncbi:hypothetical protein ACC785_39285, partial [Rhizobium ruizarguesonis]
AVAMPLPELWAKQGRIERSAASGSLSFDPGPAIVLSGSCSAMTNRQVAEIYRIMLTQLRETVFRHHLAVLAVVVR